MNNMSLYIEPLTKLINRSIKEVVVASHKKRHMNAVSNHKPISILSVNLLKTCIVSLQKLYATDLFFHNNKICYAWYVVNHFD